MCCLCVAAQGKGDYFAVNFCLSASHRFAKPDENNVKHILLCRVITGNFAVGNPTMKSAPVYDEDKSTLYHSVVNSLADPTVFVTFNDWAAYPAYMINFKDD